MAAIFLYVTRLYIRIGPMDPFAFGMPVGGMGPQRLMSGGMRGRMRLPAVHRGAMRGGMQLIAIQNYVCLKDLNGLMVIGIHSNDLISVLSLIRPKKMFEPMFPVNIGPKLGKEGVIYFYIHFILAWKDCIVQCIVIIICWCSKYIIIRNLLTLINNYWNKTK